MGTFSNIVLNHSSYTYSWRVNSCQCLTLLCNVSSINYMDPSVFSLEREETRIWNAFFYPLQTRHPSRLFWKYTYTFGQANEASSGRQISLLQPVQPQSLFPSECPSCKQSSSRCPLCGSSTAKYGASSKDIPLSSANQRELFSLACLRI